MRFAVILLTACLALAPVGAVAQDRETLADIRQELTVLYVEIQRLRRELSTTGAPSVQAGGSTMLDRVVSIEDELRRLTAQTEALQHRVERIVADGTNRIGDLEFRLVELEGGDIGTLGETTTLGGGELPVVAAPDPEPVDQTEFAVGETADFMAASDKMKDGDYATAVALFAAFNDTYPSSPLAPEADLQRGRALDQMGDTREAARAYLASFTGNGTGPVAPEALYELGYALGRLGQVDQACITLGEVGVRFPASEAASRARAKMAELACS